MRDDRRCKMQVPSSLQSASSHLRLTMKSTLLALVVSGCAAFSPTLAPRIGGAARALPVVAARSPLVAVPAAVPVAPRARRPQWGCSASAGRSSA